MTAAALSVADLDRRLQELHVHTTETPLFNPVFQLGLELSRQLESGALSQNLELRDGDTIFVPRAETVYVFGQVKNPGAYGLQKNMTVLQALSLAGGVNEHGAMNRLQVMRIINGTKKELKVKLTDLVRPEDTIIVPQRFF